MIMSEQTIPIPGRLKNVAIGGHVAGSEDIDAGGGKTQKQVNDETNATLASHQSAIGGLNSQNYVSVSSYSSLPATGSVDTVYRVSSYDGTQVDATKYAEYSWNGSAYVLLDVKTQIGEVFDISEYKAVGGTLATFEDLSAALDSGNNVPVGVRKGGMSVKFVQSSDNKYVQFRYMGTDVTGTPNPFLDTANWQGVDEEPVIGSQNLVESSGVYNSFNSRNLFDKDNPNKVVGKWHQSNGGEVTNPLFEYYVITEVWAPNKYIVSGATNFHLDFFNDDICIDAVTEEQGNTFTVPSGTNKIYLSILITQESTLQIEVGTVATPYVSYGNKFKKLENAISEITGDIDNINGDINDIKGDIESIESQLEEYDGNKIKEHSIRTRALVDSLYNLFNKADSSKVTGKWHNSNGEIISNVLWEYFTFTDVWNTSTPIIFSGVTFIHLDFFKNGVCIGYINEESAGVPVFTIPDGTDTIYLSILRSEESTCQIEYGNIAHDYMPYGDIKLSPSIIPQIIPQKTVVLYKKAFNNVVDTDFTNAVAANFTAEGLLLQDSTEITLSKMYAITGRTLRLLCQFESGTIFKIKSSSNDSVVTIDVASGTITCNSTSITTNILNNTDLYVVEIIYRRQVGIVRVTNIITTESAEITKTRNGVGGYGQGAIGTQDDGFGVWHDYYVFTLDSTSTGDCLIKDMCIVSDDCDCDLIIYGDSITEEQAYFPTADYNDSWTMLVKENCGKVLISGRGGYSIDSLLVWIQNELPFIKAKYVMVTIGTNGGNTKEKLTTLVDYIKQCDAIPILNNIPCNEHSTQVSDNAIISEVRNECKINGCRFDVATSLAGDGANVDTSKMYWEDYGGSTGSIYHHPNVKGSKAMFAQLKIDVPEIFKN